MKTKSKKAPILPKERRTLSDFDVCCPEEVDPVQSQAAAQEPGR
jgi:hypothetical protein